MKNYIYKPVILLLLILPKYAEAGNKNDSIARISADLKAKAIRYDREKDVYNAISYYSRYLHYKSKDIKLNYRLASLYFETRDYQKSYQYFDSTLRLNKFKYPLAWYYKGIVCMSLGKYDESADLLTRFRKIYKNNDNYRKLAAIYIESATWAKSQPESGDEIEVAHPGNILNHSDIDFAPFPVDENEILYGAVYTDNSKSIGPVRQIFKASKINGQWKSQGRLEGELNSPDYNTGNAVISENGRHMYFTRTRKNWQNADISEIYMSRLANDQWQTPEKLPYPINNENYTSTQPAIGRNMRTGNEVLFFVSDRAGGKGGLDIWYTEFDRKTNSYREPQALDKNVNTPDDECCPFYDVSTSTLYFSSRGKKNELGGYDIFKATGSTKKWTEAVPMPKPVNSTYDDYYFSVLPNNKGGYFTSNRPASMNQENGSCCDDIFTFQRNECAVVSAGGNIRNSTDYDIYDDFNEQYHLGLEYPHDSSALADVPVELFLQGETEADEILVSKTTTNEAGIYHFDLERNKHYKLLVRNFGYFEKRVAVSTVGVNCSDIVNLGVTHINYLPKVNFRVNIYYDHDRFDLSYDARKTIDTTLIPLFDLFPNAILEIGSHTDNTGTDEYNDKLSQQRSESVVAYLQAKGIPAKRITAKGYGMRVPVASNTTSDGSDNPEGRKLNRRTEIKIVGDITIFNKDE
jgi:OmpA-OmpF porin, OOP family